MASLDSAQLRMLVPSRTSHWCAAAVTTSVRRSPVPSRRSWGERSCSGVAQLVATGVPSCARHVDPGAVLCNVCFMTVEQRIREAELSPAERRIAEEVLANPQTVAFGTVAALADVTGTSGATVVRL